MVIVNEGHELDAQAVLAHCEKIFAKWQLPDEIIQTDAIPLTSTGKIDKKVIRAQLEADGYKLPSLR
jgi:fatty-acyl-CoA synthase